LVFRTAFANVSAYKEPDSTWFFQRFGLVFVGPPLQCFGGQGYWTSVVFSRNWFWSSGLDLVGCSGYWFVLLDTGLRFGLFKELVLVFRLGFGRFFWILVCSSGYRIFSFSLIADTKKQRRRAEKNRTLCYCEVVVSESESVELTTTDNPCYLLIFSA
jgi:hypothetical protein